MGRCWHVGCEILPCSYKKLENIITKSEASWDRHKIWKKSKRKLFHSTNKRIKNDTKKPTNHLVLIRLQSASQTRIFFHLFDLDSNLKFCSIAESTPACSANITSISNGSLGYIRMQCIVNFRGPLSPTMEWRQVDEDFGKEERLLKDDIKTFVIPNSNVRSSLETFVDPNASSYHVFCRTFFNPPRRIDTKIAANAPDYSYSWHQFMSVVASSTPAEDSSSNEKASTTDAINSTDDQFYVSDKRIRLIIDFQ